MNIEKTEKTGNEGQSYTQIGYFKGSIICINPNAKQVKELKGIESDIKEPVYQGEDKNGNDRSMIKILFKEEKGAIVEGAIFLQKEENEWDNDKNEHKIEYINQHGKTQVVEKEADLWESFKQLQKWSKEDGKFIDVLGEDKKPIKLIYRKAYKGEAELYTLLRAAVKVDWFKATEATNMFIPFNDLMKGKVGTLNDMITNEDLDSVVGMVEVVSKDTDNGIRYDSACIGRAWMPGFRINQCNLFTQNGTWATLGEEEAKKNSKLYDIRGFYYWCNKSKHSVEYVYLHSFDPSLHLAAGNNVISHSEPATDMEYDISQ